MEVCRPVNPHVQTFKKSKSASLSVFLSLSLSHAHTLSLFLSHAHTNPLSLFLSLYIYSLYSFKGVWRSCWPWRSLSLSRTHAHSLCLYMCILSILSKLYKKVVGRDGVDGQRQYPRSDDFLVRDKCICVHTHMYTIHTYVVSMGNGGTLARMIFWFVTNIYAYICTCIHYIPI